MCIKMHINFGETGETPVISMSLHERKAMCRLIEDITRLSKVKTWRIVNCLNYKCIAHSLYKCIARTGSLPESRYLNPISGQSVAD